MEKRVLFVATTAKGHMNVFHVPYIKRFKEKGWKVDSVTNGDEPVPYVDNDYAITIERSPFRLGNIRAIKQLCHILKERRYTLLICHTPMGGVVTRIAARICAVAPVIYMAHGFHFYQGAPLINRVLYKPMEQFLAHWTDGLIVINQEDYEAAKHFRLRKNGKVYLTNGIGADVQKIQKTIIDKKQKRKEFGIDENSFVVLNIGEMITRKNQRAAIEAMSFVENDRSVLLICGRGEKEQELRSLAEAKELKERVIFAGFRCDISEILKIADVFLFPSYQEGLPVAVIEAMAAGLPIICSNIRGNRDLVDRNGGFLVEPDDVEAMGRYIDYLSVMKASCSHMGEHNEKTARKYSVDSVMLEMEKIYEDIIGRKL